VLRLKGGDPYVFGRGGEEMLYLQQRGIKVHCIPGVHAWSSVTLVAFRATGHFES
jgi:uroporphyrin-III C-methyltransferase